MANLTEASVFEPGIYQLETTDPVQGGSNGISNQQGKQLANRTRWLRDAHDALSADYHAFKALGTVLAGIETASDTSTLTSTAWGKFVNCSTESGAFALTLPELTNNVVGRVIVVKHDFNAGNFDGVVTVRGNGSQNISYESFFSNSLELQPGDVVVLVASNTPALRWEVAALYRNAQQVPTGSIQAMATQVVPLGYLKANGQVVSRTTFARLFAVIGTTFNTGGETSQQFRLPDLRGEFIRGWDDGRGVDSGRTLGSEQGQAIQSHDHVMPSTDVSTSAGSGTKVIGGANQGQVTLATGGAETRPRNVALMYVIKT